MELENAAEPDLASAVAAAHATESVLAVLGARSAVEARPGNVTAEERRTVGKLVQELPQWNPMECS